ncbi:MAG: FG-GAP-like repeat-containing protein [Planctomycetota bacterium]
MPFRRVHTFSPLGALLLSICLLLPTVDAQVLFVDEAAARGYSVVIPSGGFGCGVAMEDLDGDGDLDLVQTMASNNAVRFYENLGTGFFVERMSGIDPNQLLGFRGVSVCDYDGDGLRDIHLTANLGPNKLLHNDGGFLFSDVTGAAGVGDTGNTMSSTWGDVDSDGAPDLYVVNFDGTIGGGGIANELYRNQGDGTFLPIGSSLGIDDPKTGFQAVFFDPDLDGDVDLYVSNDRGQFNPSWFHNEFWRNDGDAFTPMDDSGAEIAIDSMGVGVGDFDRNGLLDLVCTNSTPGLTEVLLAEGDGTTFSSGTLASGVGSPNIGWAVEFLDCDQDGHLELYVVNSNELNHLWYGPNFPCTDIALSAGVQDPGYSALPAWTFNAASGDVDGDGDLDLISISTNQPATLYINQTPGIGNWLIVDLVGTGLNRDAIGATILVDTAGETQIRQVRAGSGFRSSSPLRQHFGIGAAGIVDRVRILWPGGDLTMLTGVAANQRIVVDRSTQQVETDCDGNLWPDDLELQLDPGLDGDLDGILDVCQPRFVRGDATADGVLNIADPINLLDYLFGLNGTECEQSLDANDDLGIDIADAIYLLGHLFAGGPPPSAPYPLCGTGSSSSSALPCATTACP